jgi:hypothetical protein
MCTAKITWARRARAFAYPTLASGLRQDHAREAPAGHPKQLDLPSCLWPAEKVPLDPHNHLHNHLPQEAIAEIKKLPKNSREQADLIISMVDKENAIDDDLRKKVYELFDRALTLESAPSALPTPLPSDPPPASGAA